MILPSPFLIILSLPGSCLSGLTPRMQREEAMRIGKEGGRFIQKEKNSPV